MSGELRSASTGPSGLRVIALALLLVLLMTACGGDGGIEEASGDSGDNAEAACGDTEIESIALLLPGKQDDQGYSQLGATAIETAAEANDITDTSIAETVDVSQQVETYREFATEGYDLVVGWGGQYEDGAVEVASQFPEACFAVFNGVGGNDSNYSSFDLAGEQWNFLVGYVLGKLTNSDTVGLISGPCFDASARQTHGVRDGVAHANPDAEVIVTGLKSFDDPAAAKEAALAQIQQGADMIHVNLNTGNLGVFEAAQGSDGVLVTTEFYDQSEAAPEVILTSSVRDATTSIEYLMEQIDSGEFGKPIRIEMTADEEALADFRELAPVSLYEEAKELQKEIVDGEFEVEPDGSCPYSGS